MDTSPALDNALSQPGVTFFLCGQADLPNYTLRLLDGASQVVWSQGTFVGYDSTFGTLAAMEAISDGVGDQAPQLSITISPPNETGVATLASPGMQGSRIRIWLGALDPATAQVIAEPYLLFDGVLDQPIVTVDKGMRELEYECVSAFEYLFMNDEGLRLSDAHHQEVWPGETGLSAVTGIVKQIIWGPGDKTAGNFYSDGAGVAGGNFGPGTEIQEYHF